MDRTPWTGRKSSAGFTARALPTMVAELEPGFVLAAQIDCPMRRVRRMGACELPANALTPLPTQENLANHGEVQRTMEQVREVIGNESSRLGLLVPDPIVRVSVLEFESLPNEHKEAEALVHWRLKEALPFALEEARVAYQVTWQEPQHLELLAMAAKSSVLAEYERAIQPGNSGPVLVLPASAALLPLLPERDETAQLLVHACCDWVTTVVVTGSRVRIWRTRHTGRGPSEGLAQEVAGEAARVVASSRDHLKVEIARVWLCARPPAGEDMMPALAAAVSRLVDPLVPSVDLVANLSSTERTLFERFGAPVAGVVLNFAGER